MLQLLLIVPIIGSLLILPIQENTIKNENKMKVEKSKSQETEKPKNQKNPPNSVLPSQSNINHITI